MSEICVRDIRPGMTVPLKGKDYVVSAIAWMDGTNGEPPIYTYIPLADGKCSKTAVAKKIELVGHEPIMAHPGLAVSSL